MDRIKDRLAQFRLQVEEADERAKGLEVKVKQLEQTLLEKEQENTSLNHRLQIAEGELDKREAQLKDAKNVGQEHETSKTTNEALSRKIQLLEEELDNAEKNLKETVERLRQMDLKAEHFERKVQSLEQERDTWENKYEEAHQKYCDSKKELDDLVSSMEGM